MRTTERDRERERVSEREREREKINMWSTLLFFIFTSYL